MSLQVEGGRRGRSRSPGRRDRDRSPGPPAAVVEASPYDRDRDDDRDDRDDRRRSAATVEYERTSSYKRDVSPGPGGPGYYRDSREKVEEDVRVKYGDSRREKEYRYEKERVVDRGPEKMNSDRNRDRGSPPRGSRDSPPRADAFAYLPQKYAVKTAEPEPGRYSREPPPRDRERERERERELDLERAREKARDREREKKRDEELAYGGAGRGSKTETSTTSTYTYAQPKPREYAKPEDYVTQTREETTTRYSGQRPSVTDARHPSVSDPREEPQYASRETKKYYRESYDAESQDPRRSSKSVVTVEPGAGPGRRDIKRSSSPQPPVARMASLSVGGLAVATAHHSGAMSVSAAPASPLLESYHGTYQSMSPMPSPMLLAARPGQEVETVSPIGSEDERLGEKKRTRRARFHDTGDDAARLAKALKGEKRAPDTEPLVEILPGLTQDQVMELRVEYKRLVKTGAEKKGVNVAKHIRARLKDEDPNLMKACYSVALGRWESEAYWANFWYQGDKTRRELLIESLMGRTNDEIRLIKEGFSDKKYSNSLTKCMKTELKEDKFKKAVLMVLDEQRMDDVDAYGRPVRLDPDLVAEDVRQLHHAVKAEKGGESLMITIVIQRSDSHLREVLRVYTEQYGGNFARDSLKKSGNLVGEVLAHILNGVINKPMRDAMLLHHALSASRKDELRRELLISRLVRYHWDRRHMAAVKAAYRERYGKDLQAVVKEHTSGEWGAFCCELCIARTPDDVRRVERIEKVERVEYRG